MKLFSNREREEIIDVVFLLLMTYFGISIIFQISFLQSSDPNLRELGRLALGLGFVSVLGISLTMLSTSTGLMRVKNLKRESFRVAVKDIVIQDETFCHDYGLTFLIAFVIQIFFTFFYGSFTGFQFNIAYTWDLNAFLLTVNAGIGEELFFSLFLTGFLLSLSSRKIITFLALAINLIGFGLVHIIVYKSNQEALIFILFLRLLYFFTYFKTRRASIPMILHCFNNFLFVKSVLYMI
ncbi:MAG: CPBP family glutamic-type intramembrane protease [Promethearchaeota archaeon]